jgi:hypothetical protein
MSRCGCDRQVSEVSQQLACLECGAACCTACAVGLESVTYCAGCARLLLGGTVIRSAGSFDLH